MQTRLLVTFADGQSREHLLTDGAYTVGSERAHIVVDAPGVSPDHGVLTVAAGTTTIVDRGSPNGIFDMAGHRIQGSYLMRPGEPLRLGGATIVVAATNGGTQPFAIPPAVAVPARAPEPTRRTRATIIKLPDATPGLLVMDGQQRRFVLEGIWRAAVAPAAGMTVDVDLDERGEIAAIHAVDAQQLAREAGVQVAGMARAVFGSATQHASKLTLGALLALWIGFFFVPALDLTLVKLTFWDVLGIDASNLFTLLRGTKNHGFFSLVGLVAIAAPAAALFWKHPRAHLLNAAPLVFVLLFLAGLGYAAYDMASDAGKTASSLSQGFSSALGSGNDAFERSLRRTAKSAQEAAIASMLFQIREALSWGISLVLLSSGILFVQAFRGKRMLSALPGALFAGGAGVVAGLGAQLPQGLGGKARDAVSRNRKWLLVGGPTALVVIGLIAIVVTRKTPGERVMAALDELQGIIETGQNDCAGTAKKLTEFSADNQGVFQALVALPADEQAEFEKTHGAEFLLQVGNVQAALMPMAFRCLAEPSYAASLVAIGSLFDGGSSAKAPVKTGSHFGVGATAALGLNAANVKESLLGLVGQKTGQAQVEPNRAVAQRAPVPATPALPLPQPTVPTPAVAPAPPSPAAAPAAIPTTFAVFGVVPGDKLNVRASADPRSATLFEFGPLASGIRSTGRTQNISGTSWLEVLGMAPNTSGWVNRSFLVEERAAACEDSRVGALAEQFINAVRRENGSALRALVSPVHGLIARTSIEGPSVRYDQNATAALFGASPTQRWSAPGSALVQGTFKDVLLPSLKRTLSTELTQTCGRVVPPPGVKVAQGWPAEIDALQPVTLSAAKADGTSHWALGIEFVGGAPFLAALVEYPAPGAPVTPADAPPTPKAPDAKAKPAEEKPEKKAAAEPAADKPEKGSEPTADKKSTSAKDKKSEKAKSKKK